MWRHRRIGLVLAGGVFIIVCVLWILYFPFRPANVLRVIPHDALAASWHVRPSERFDAGLKSAPAVVAMALMDVDRESVIASRHDPQIDALVERLGAKAMTVAFVPGLGAHDSPAIVFGAWVGGWATHMLRTGWLDSAFEGYSMHRIGNDRLWVTMVSDNPLSLRYISWGVFEGVLAGCVSSDPFAALSLLRLLRRHGPLAPLVQPWIGDKGQLRDDMPDKLDRFRVYLQNDGATGLTLDGEVHLDDTGDWRFRVRIEDHTLPWLPSPRKSPETLRSEMAHVHSWLDRPADVAVWATVSRGQMREWQDLAMPFWRQHTWLPLLDQLVSPDGVSILWLAGGDYGGRIMRMRIPAAGLALQVPPSLTIDDIAKRLADAVNASYGVGWMPLPDRQDPKVMVFHPVQAGLFADATAYPAATLYNGWLLLSSNTGALKRLLAHQLQTQSIAPTLLDASDSVFKICRLQADLPETASVATTAIAGYALFSLMQTGSAVRFDTPKVQRVIQAMHKGRVLDGSMGYDAEGQLQVEGRWTEKENDRNE